MGYDLEFFASRSQAEKFFCVVCQGVAKEILETDCGHIFCRSCIGELIAATNDDDDQTETHCPHCRSVISWKMVHASKFLDREVFNLQTMCTQCNEWNGSLMKLDDHQSNECSHHWMECEWKLFGCQVKVKRKDMGEHNETFTVNHLTLKVTHLTNKNKCWENTVQKLKRDMRSKEQKWKHKIQELRKQISMLSGMPKNRKRPNTNECSINLMVGQEMAFKRRRISSAPISDADERSTNSNSNRYRNYTNISTLTMLSNNYGTSNDRRRRRGRSHQRMSEGNRSASSLANFSPDSSVRSHIMSAFNVNGGNTDHEDSA